ncbi:hypothetical protein O6H91_05G118100 [Diphasiastrum complanatum]|uniref:Uncharacterized protein n=1 Tax=Diphasiastrum complanatum TaxID=34168 RepID=A0ACC2DSN5_DIPCM|nr:hypothetical protein O6H91_05G118100 [Diphasiastrum complanatum]
MFFSRKYTCKRPGVIFCGACSLVSHCSSQWQHRRQWSSTYQTHLQQKLPKSFDFSWGNVPAYSLFDGSSVDAKLPKHLQLCFAASGDLRNIVETVCKLPHNCEEKVTIYISDRNPNIAARNFLLLELLKEYGYEAIDTVIGAWYSFFLTEQQSSLITRVATAAVKRPSDNDLVDMDIFIPFTGAFSMAAPSDMLKSGSRSSSLITHFNPQVWEMLSSICKVSSTSHSMLEVHDEEYLLGSNFAKRKLHRLRPPHSLGWMEFHKWGILLPFGASRAGFKQPNPFLFEPGHGWILSEEDDPLNGWDPLEVLPAGLRHGLSSMDLYGCLFFHLKERLTLFVNRLHTCNIDLRIFCEDASQLAERLKKSKICLHSVDTSNMTDSNYLGIKKVLLDWGPTLDRCSDYKTTLITFLMNWAYETPKAKEHTTLSKMTWRDIEAAISSIAKKGSGAKYILGLFVEGNEVGDISVLNYFHDFDNMFSDYLDSKFTARAAADVGLQRRGKHCVVPHRFFVSKNASATIYPGISATFEECYYHTVVSELNLTERFVEWEVTDQEK